MATAESQVHVPPQNLEAERSVLGAMMVSASSLDPVFADVRLKAEDFYRDKHRVVFEAIKALFDRDDAIDALTVVEYLTQTGQLGAAGGKEEVQSLPDLVPAPGNAGHYGAIVKQNSVLRRLLAAGQQIQQSVHQHEGEPRDLVEQAEALLFRVALEERARDLRALSSVLHEEIDRLEAISRGDLALTGTPSGYEDLDSMLGGFQPGNLVVLAARPSVGKSALVCNIAENVAAKKGLPVAFFSLEMSEAELAHRFIASWAKVPGDKLRKGQVKGAWPKVVKACNALEKAPLWLDDSSDLGMVDLRAKARRLVASQGDVSLIIVDYMQLMRPEDPRSNRVEQVGQISRGLKILARELDVPVIGVSQLSRAPEARPGGRPMLSDLRESGCITGDSRVFLPAEGGYAPISHLVGRTDVEVLALDRGTWKLVRTRASNVFPTGRNPVFKLRTALGREIRATANHKFLTIDGWRRLDELQPGTRITLPRRLATGDVDWDRVASIESDGVEEVFDMTVPGPHNFVADDIVVHNSIEQDADVVMFIYREALYREEADPSEAELIIAKHRNGPIGDVSLVFLDKYPRFIARSFREERTAELTPGGEPPIVEAADEA